MYELISHDLLLHILSFTSLVDLCAMCGVCAQIRKFLQQDESHIWRLFLKDVWWYKCLLRPQCDFPFWCSAFAPRTRFPYDFDPLQTVFQIFAELTTGSDVQRCAHVSFGSFRPMGSNPAYNFWVSSGCPMWEKDETEPYVSKRLRYPFNKHGVFLPSVSILKLFVVFQSQNRLHTTALPHRVIRDVSDPVPGPYFTHDICVFAENNPIMSRWNACEKTVELQIMPPVNVCLQEWIWTLLQQTFERRQSLSVSS
jgi:hypothetical protein